MSTVYFAPRMALKPFLIALSVALPVCAQANVAATANAQITGLTYRLVDLDTNDGIAPTITFNNQINTFLNHTNYYLPDGYASAYDASAPYTGLLPDTALNTSLISESATATSQGFLASASASTNEAFANIDPANRRYENFSVRSESSLSVNPGLYDDLGNPISITLSANTALFISGVATVKGQFDKDAFVAQAAAMPGLNDAYVWDYDMMGASAGLDLGTQSFETDEYGNVFATTINSSSSQLTHAYGETNFERTKSLNVQFANLTGSDVSVVLGVHTSAYARLEGSLDFRDVNIDPNPPVTPPSIPEPGTYLLMGLGLAGIGLARRRTSV
ncbi:MAG: PEP-CTERM sorting domain-containing protein [Aquabacterium sp.]|uniref:PEP-CTERM sorting domain-containing protein n=1 Tax=Aquabacterium sp. TaxID=1872578 RepID=UPI0025C42E40|nr:PEP-CTERM sorting domain-containing protein [Aquabacterium sp.]MBI5926787.1 PEP-CTERM sorting domain-containing protein [Aquabacterium sp.]